MQILYQIADPIKAIIAYVIETNKLGGCQKERGSNIQKSLSTTPQAFQFDVYNVLNPLSSTNDFSRSRTHWLIRSP